MQAQLKLIKNPNESNILLYKIARVVYAETCAASLRVVEALTAMIENYARISGRDFLDIISDENIFESINRTSARHEYLTIDAQNRGFKMCLRVVERMLHGNLEDMCCGATKFHRADLMPNWAISRGYIADIDGLLFYL